jgi:hypothetical protein
MIDVHYFLKPKRRYQGRVRYPRPKGEQFGGHAADEKRAAGIRAAWDDPLRRALMSRRKTDGLQG